MGPGNVYVGGDFLHDETGTRIDTHGKFVGKAVRESMAAFGIPDGSTFVADYLGPDKEARLGYGDVVVIDGLAAHSEPGWRLRVIDRINPDSTVSFKPDGFANERRTRPLTEVVAKVTHVTDPDASAQIGFAWGFLTRFFVSKAAA